MVVFKNKMKNELDNINDFEKLDSYNKERMRKIKELTEKNINLLKKQINGEFNRFGCI